MTVSIIWTILANPLANNTIVVMLEVVQVEIVEVVEVVEVM